MLQNVFGDLANDKTITDLYNMMAFYMDRLEYGINTDSAKQLRVSLAGSGALGTVNTVGTVTNQQLIGGIAAQRTVEAQMDTAYNVGFLNNITF